MRRVIIEMGMVEVEIAGRPHQVPEGITAVQALWHAGHELIQGIGCLGGVCGACPFTYSKKGEPGVKTGLACQTVIVPGMSFSPPSSMSVRGPRYRVREIEDPQSALLKYYPETRRCTRCNACTLVCPQEIDVRSCVVKSLSGEFADVSDMIYNCVMCGLCTAVCDVAIKPNLVALFARRTQAACLMPRPENLSKCLERMESGADTEEWQKVLSTDP